MLSFLLKRILYALPVLLIIASLTFVLVRLVPGGPFDAEKNLPPEIVKNLEAKYNLDKPVHEQYFLYLGRLARGDLGVSYKYVNRTVNDIIGDAFPVSLQLGLIGLTIAIFVGVPLGAIAAVNRGTAIDYAAMFISTAGISLPSFVIGAGLIFLFGIELKILPVALWESPQHMILPAVTLAFAPAAYLSRLTRASVLEILEKDWVRTARSKGLSHFSTIVKHVIRNALVPVITVLGPITASLVTGSFVVEYIYAIPGMGRFFITAVGNRDYDLIMATTLLFALLLLLTNTLVDIGYKFLDPRMEVEG
ncbi:MAG: ABC transporter permease [Candidatus Obscuribacterales bacterium]|nr:ABC transporter permease [Candidatus Obscuribacterales bacterium]